MADLKELCGASMGFLQNVHHPILVETYGKALVPTWLSMCHMHGFPSPLTKMFALFHAKALNLDGTTHGFRMFPFVSIVHLQPLCQLNQQ